jgi:hypothetical protein
MEGKSAVAVAGDVTLAITVTVTVAVAVAVAQIYGWRVGLNLPLLLLLPLPKFMDGSCLKFDNCVAGEVGQYYCSYVTQILQLKKGAK